MLSVVPSFTVKVSGAASLDSVRSMNGWRMNVFKLANRVVYQRKVLGGKVGMRQCRA